MSKIDPCILFYIFIYLSCLYTSGTPIFSICLVYTMYIPDIWECHQYVWYIGGISMYIHGISNGVDIYCISKDIHCISKDIPCISIEDIHGISLYIHGISEDVYTWYIRVISMYIPSFFFLDFLAGPCSWSQSMHTLVLVIKIGLFHAPPWQLCLGIRRPTKGSLLLSPRRGRRWRLALRGAAGRLRGGRLGGLVLVTMP